MSGILRPCGWTFCALANAANDQCDNCMKGGLLVGVHPDLPLDLKVPNFHDCAVQVRVVVGVPVDVDGWADLTPATLGCTHYALDMAIVCGASGGVLHLPDGSTVPHTDWGLLEHEDERGLFYRCAAESWLPRDRPARLGFRVTDSTRVRFTGCTGRHVVLRFTKTNVLRIRRLEDAAPLTQRDIVKALLGGRERRCRWLLK